jgi:plasmid maintenance system killer protein
MRSSLATSTIRPNFTNKRRLNYGKTQRVMITRKMKMMKKRKLVTMKSLRMIKKKLRIIRTARNVRVINCSKSLKHSKKMGK